MPGGKKEQQRRLHEERTMNVRMKEKRKRRTKESARQLQKQTKGNEERTRRERKKYRKEEITKEST